MATSIIVKNNFLEVGLTQNHVTNSLRMHTTIDLLYIIMCETLR